jgi:hypothetical protein
MFQEPNDSKEQWFIDPRMTIRPSLVPAAGIGCFALEDIPARTMIESSPVIICSPNTFTHLNQIHHKVRHILSDYPFRWPDGNRAFALGWGGIYNHSSSSHNVQWTFKTADKHGFNAICFFTKIDVLAGEELFIRYHPDSEQLWFTDEEAEQANPTSPSMIRRDIKNFGTYGMRMSDFVRKQYKRPDTQRTSHKETIGSWKLLDNEEE